MLLLHKGNIALNPFTNDPGKACITRLKALKKRTSASQIPPAKQMQGAPETLTLSSWVCLRVTQGF